MQSPIDIPIAAHVDDAICTARFPRARRPEKRGNRSCRQVVWFLGGQGSLAPRVQGPLSVRAVWHGVESYLIGRRTLCVDEDRYLVINEGREYSVLAQRRDAAKSLTVFLAEIAERSGFGSRWSMFRELRGRRCMSGRRIRESWVRSAANALASSV